ncbi:MAG: YfcE family phosphodiesterase [Thermodesulfobacteriota bacterium]
MSDTHLTHPSELFKAQIANCFSDVAMVFHAGDLTSGDVMDAFSGREVVAVCGNMCDASSRSKFPPVQHLEINGFKIVLTHGHSYGYQNIEDRLFTEFAEADCIVYGHTHSPVCHKSGGILFINPGSFNMAGRFGSPGTYAILEIDQELHAQIHQVPDLT